jgi:anti-sigma regulatory factor (Ser/Thr protein kinase)
VPDDTLTITLSSHYYLPRLERLLRQLEQLLVLDEPRQVLVDLRGLTGIGPTCLTVLVATLVRTGELGLFADGSQMVPPKSPPVSRYVQRMNLVDLVVPEQVAEAFERHDEHGFMPCRRFATLDEGVNVGRTLSDHLQEKCSVDDVGKTSVQIALGEITDNVPYHAHTAHGGFAMCQHFPRRDMFEIVIADLGVGIRSSLTRNRDLPTPDDDAAALDLALTPRVTSTPDRNAGLGLFVTAMLLEANGGQFYLRSGNAVAHRGAEDDTLGGRVAFPGTLATLQVRTDRPLNIESVYARFTKELGDADD